MPTLREIEEALADPQRRIAIARVIGRAITFEEEAFENDQPVNGGDMVDFFSGWREMCKVVVTP